MVMSRKEYEQMEFYKTTAIRFEKDYNQKIEEIKDLKSFLRVAIRMAEINDIQDKVIVYEELLQYIEKFI